MGKIRKVLIIILLLAAFVSGVLVAIDYIGRMKEAKEYEKLAEIVQTTEQAGAEESSTEEKEKDGEESYVSPVDFDKLVEMNPETVGWIKIPDTPIDYPIVQTGNNDKYLHTDFNGRESVGGAIYLDFESSADMKGKNNILYGHHMKNGSMFKALVNYKDKAYFEDHPYFTIYTPEEEIRLRIISAYYGEADPEARRTRFQSQEAFDEFVDSMISLCPYAVKLDGEVDSLYTLITCSYEFDDARTFVFAVPADEDGNIIYTEEKK